MTDERKIGGNRWTDFVKEYAQAHNVSYMCASTNPEVKAEWKNKKGAEKTKKAPKAPPVAKLSHEQVVEKAIAKAKSTVQEPPKPKGRPKKYATPEEAHRAKLESTKISVQKKRASQPKKRRQKNPLDDIEMKTFLAKSKEELDHLQSLIEAYVKEHPIPSLDQADKKRLFHHIGVLDEKRRQMGLIPKRGKGRKPKALTSVEIPNSVCSVPTPSEPISLTIEDFKPKKRGRPKKAKKEAPAFHSFDGKGYDNGEMGPMGEARPKRTGGMDPPTYPPGLEIPTLQPFPSRRPTSTYAPSRPIGEWYENPLVLTFGGAFGLMAFCVSIFGLTALTRAVARQFRNYRQGRRVVPGDVEMQEIELDDPLAEWGREFGVPTAVVAFARDNIEHALETRPLDEVENVALDTMLEIRDNPTVFFNLAREALPFAEAYEPITNADVRALQRNPYGDVFDPHGNQIEIDRVQAHPLVYHPVAPSEQSPDEPVGRGFDLRRVFNNYGKIKDHLGKHLSDLKEPVDPKDVRDYIYFTKEQARLKDKLTGSGFFDNIGNAFKTTFNAPPKSNAERDALKFFYNDFLPVASAPVNIIAPPVGMLSDKVFSGLKEQHLGQGRGRKG